MVSGNFENYVREHDQALPGMAPYVQERLRGRAAGKIVERSDGTAELLIDAAVLDVDRDEHEDPVRLFTHEALHLIIRRRGSRPAGDGRGWAT